jgi:hypothetical protein
VNETKKYKPPYHLWRRVILYLMFLVGASILVTETPLHDLWYAVDALFVAGTVLIFGLHRG